MATRYSNALPRDLRFEPTPKRIRALLGDTTVADTTQGVLVWEPERIVPVYGIPRADVEQASLREEPDLRAGSHTAPLAAAWALAGPGPVREHAAWRYEDPDLAGFVVLDWKALDAWYEEDERVIAHPRDPFHRVDARRSSRHVRVELEGHVLADSRRPTLVFETGLPVRHYLPRTDVRTDLLEPSDKRTGCAYKGVAAYFSAALEGVDGRDVAWTYPDPLDDSAALRELVCFLGEKLDVIVDGHRLPRPSTQWS